MDLFSFFYMLYPVMPAPLVEYACFFPFTILCFVLLDVVDFMISGFYFLL